MRLHRMIVVSLVLLLIVLATGCKPKVGGKCTTGNSFCTKEGALFCGDDNKLVATSCLGPNGCIQTGKHAACDQSLANAGDPCEDNENIACSADKRAQLDCINHKWTLAATCHGAKGCELKGDELFCDHTIADKDDPCHRDGQIACTADKTLILKCQDKVFRAVDSCRGGKGCSFEEQPALDRIEFNCDDSVAQEGDVCAQEELHACAVDKKFIFVCKDHKFVQQKACPGPKGCTIDLVAEKLSCDTGSGIFTGRGGSGKVSQVGGNAAGATGAKAKTGADAGAKAVTAADAGAKPGTSASAAVAASAKPGTSASAAASASAKPGASAAASASAKPGASAKPVPTTKKK